jgi:hypothetical protein
LSVRRVHLEFDDLGVQEGHTLTRH